MLSRSLRVTRLAGIDVRVHPSLLLFAVVIAWVFGTGFLARHGLGTTVVMALAATALFLASVLAHELAHGLEARYRGITVHGITLFFFGGLTEMRARSRSPRDEFAVSAVGPYASLVCAAAFGLVVAFAPGLGPLERPVADVAGLLAWLNLFLAVFNLVPGAPLDGGRVLRAGLWWLLGDRDRAVRVAGRCGQTLAAGLAALGLAMLAIDLGWLTVPEGPGSSVWWQLAGSRAFGVVLLLVGVFIFQAARTELSQADLDRLLDTGRVGDLLGDPPPRLPVDRPLDLADPGTNARLLPVVDGDTVVGALPAARLAELHATDRAARTAGELMEPVTDPPEVTPETPLRRLVDHLVAGAPTVVVRDGPTPVAVLSEPEVARGLRRLQGRPAPRRGPSRRGPTRPGDDRPRQGSDA